MAVPEQVTELLALWAIPDDAQLTAMQRGTNNRTFAVVRGEQRWVLRVSQNLSPDQVRAEHRLLGRLHRARLPFRVPEPVPTVTGETVIDSPGGPVSVCRWIPGVRPDLSSEPALERFGRAIGVLSRAMRDLPLDEAPQDWRAGPLTALGSRADVEQLCLELDAAGAGHERVELLRTAGRRVGAWWSEGTHELPVQIVHGDLGASNSLADESTGRITALLDFEIAGADFRIQDLVAGLLLTGALAAPDWQGPAAALIRGARSVMPLRPSEIKALPDLLLCRAVGTVLWRAGRWRRGHADLGDVVDRLQELEVTARWLKASAAQLVSLG